MKKAILFLTIFCICCIPLFSQAVYIIDGHNIFKDCFKDPIEKVFFVLWDGRTYGFTTSHEGFVRAQYHAIKEELEREGVKISDIAIVMHNHFVNPFFSHTDLRTWVLLRTDGFRGSFAIYMTASNEVKYLRDETAELKQFLRKKETRRFLKQFKRDYPKAYKEIINFLKKHSGGKL